MSEANKLVLDGVAWLGNVSTSVAIIFINKVLMAKTGYGFVYGAPDPLEKSLSQDVSPPCDTYVTCSHNTLCFALPSLLSQHLGDPNLWWGQESQTSLSRQVIAALLLLGIAELQSS